MFTLSVLAFAVFCVAMAVHGESSSTEAAKAEEYDSMALKQVSVQYGTGVIVAKGNELTPTSVKDKPSHITYPAEDSSLYTLAFFDTDAPSRSDPKRHEILHWLVVNIPGKQWTQGEEHVGYVGAGAPQGSGLHRYTFLVYKQPNKLILSEAKLTPQLLGWRPLFHASAFAKKYNLGQPIASSYFQAKFDAYVPTLHAQFTDLPPQN